MARRVYCIDTSALIEAWVQQFPPDVVASFWPKMDGLVRSGRLIAPEDVREELRHPPELKQWADERDDLFRELDGDHEQRLVREVVDDIREAATNRGLRLLQRDFKADPFVVALARSEGTVVVHQERAANQPSARPKIPNVCAWYDVPAMNLLAFVRAQGWTF